MKLSAEVSRTQQSIRYNRMTPGGNRIPTAVNKAIIAPAAQGGVTLQYVDDIGEVLDTKECVDTIAAKKLALNELQIQEGQWTPA
jgi:hypothetical protein